MTDQSCYRDALRSELLAGVGHYRHVRKRRRLITAAMVTCTAAAAALAGIGGGEKLPGVSSALAITREGDDVVITVRDAAASPERMTRELRAAGIDGEVAAVPVARSFVGRWVAVEATPSLHPDPREEHREVGHRRSVRIPARYRGTVELSVGRKARPGERLYEDIVDFDDLPADERRRIRRQQNGRSP